jgi:hypothetical protein
MGFHFCKVGMFLELLLECSQLVFLCAKKGSVCVCMFLKLLGNVLESLTNR